MVLVRTLPCTTVVLTMRSEVCTVNRARPPATSSNCSASSVWGPKLDCSGGISSPVARPSVVSTMLTRVGPNASSAARARRPRFVKGRGRGRRRRRGCAGRRHGLRSRGGGLRAAAPEGETHPDQEHAEEDHRQGSEVWISRGLHARSPRKRPTQVRRQESATESRLSGPSHPSCTAFILKPW